MATQHKRAADARPAKGGGKPVAVVSAEESALAEQDLAIRAAEAFYSEKKKRFGIVPPRRSRSFENDPSWNTGFRRVGSLCYAHGWDPWDYVRFAFYLMNDQGQFMIGRDLVDERVRMAYDRATREELDECSPESDWSFNEQELYKRAGKDEKLASSYLMSPLYGFPAWFRYVKGDKAVRKAWKDAALRDVRTHTDLREWLEDRFPRIAEALK